MGAIEFEIPIEAVPKSRPRVTSEGRAYTPKNTVRWEQTVALVAAAHTSQEPLEGPVRVVLDFVLSRPLSLLRKKDPDGLIPHFKRPDLDNLVKAVLDGLQAVWRDDGQVAQVLASKFYAERSGKPRVRVRIEALKTSEPALTVQA